VLTNSTVAFLVENNQELNYGNNIRIFDLAM